MHAMPAAPYPLLSARHRIAAPFVLLHVHSASLSGCDTDVMFPLQGITGGVESMEPFQRLVSLTLCILSTGEVARQLDCM